MLGTLIGARAVSYGRWSCRRGVWPDRCHGRLVGMQAGCQGYHGEEARGFAHVSHDAGWECWTAHVRRVFPFYSRWEIREGLPNSGLV